MMSLKNIVAIAVAFTAICLHAGGKCCSAAAAKQVNMLYLGDSLADFDRGSNHVDRLQARFDAETPGKIKIRNFAIRGDYIERMMDRMNGKKGTYALKRYEGIWDVSYDWAIVSLGHNDTRARSDTDFTVPLMTEAQIRSGFKDLIALLKSKGVKRIILRSAASCNFEVTSKNAEKRLAAIKAGKIKPKKGKSPVATRFGDPKHLEAFNAIMAELASVDPAVEYFDIYTGMKSRPDKASLFRSTDGVHLSQKGHEFLADVEYAYLSK